jgi:hypothetical protein
VKTTIEQKQALLQKFGGKCAYCDVRLFVVCKSKNHKITVDHFIPVSKSGSDNLDNLVASCVKCNSIKGDMWPIDFILHSDRYNKIVNILGIKTQNKNDNDSLTDTPAARKAQYGDFSDHARVAQELKDICRAAPSWGNMLPVHKEAMDMVMHKAARLLCGNPNHVDSWHDIGGYARCAEERCKESADACQPPKA